MLTAERKLSIARAVRMENRRQFGRAVPSLEKLRGARLLMTGCSGLFGLWLLDLLDLGNRELGLGITIVALTRDKSAFAERFPQFVEMPCLVLEEGDIRSFKIRSALPTHLIHAATTTAAETFRGTGPLDKFDTLVSGPANLFRQIPRGSCLRSAIFLSSGVVYGALPSGAQYFEETQDSAPQPSDVSSGLGHAKRAAEFLCHAFAADRDFALRVARCFAFSGAGLPLDLHYALGDFVHQAASGHRVLIRGDGTAVRSYMHLGDMAIWVLCLLTEEDSSLPATVNVGSPIGMTIKEVAEAVAARFGPRREVVVMGRSDYSVGNPVRSRYVPSTRRAAMFGLEAWTSFEDSVDNMLTAIEIGH